MISNTQKSVIRNTGKDLKDLIGMAEWWVLVQVQKNMSADCNVGQFDIGQLGYGISLVQHFGMSKF